MTIEPQETSQIGLQRAMARRQYWNRFDPVYFALDRIAFASFFAPHLPGDNEFPAAIESSEVAFLLENIKKHRLIGWINLGLLIFASFGGLGTLTDGELQMLASGLFAPSVVAGVAWYTISFSGVPERFIRNAMKVTSMLFLGGSVSMTLLGVAVAMLLDRFAATMVLLLVHVSMYLSAIIYDNLDGLRATSGLGQASFSRAQTYVHENVSYAAARAAAATRPGGSGNAEDPFAQLGAMIERLLDTLSTAQPPTIANVIIADCLVKLVRMLELCSQPIDLGPPFRELIIDAHALSVDDLNQQSAHYIRVIVERLQSVLGQDAIEDLASVTSTLDRIEGIRSDASASSVNSALGHDARQALADFLFVEVFRHLLYVMRTRRAALTIAND